MQGALFFLAPVTVTEGRGNDSIPMEPDVAILYEQCSIWKGVSRALQ